MKAEDIEDLLWCLAANVMGLGLFACCVGCFVMAVRCA